MTKHLICTAKESLQRTLNKVNRTAKNYRMKIYSSKTKVMRTARRQEPPINMRIANETIKSFQRLRKYYNTRKRQQ